MLNSLKVLLRLKLHHLRDHHQHLTKKHKLNLKIFVLLFVKFTKFMLHVMYDNSKDKQLHKNTKVMVVLQM